MQDMRTEKINKYIKELLKVFSIQYLTNDNYRIADREYKINASFDNI